MGNQPQIPPTFTAAEWQVIHAHMKEIAGLRLMRLKAADVVAGLLNRTADEVLKAIDGKVRP